MLPIFTNPKRPYAMFDLQTFAGLIFAKGQPAPYKPRRCNFFHNEGVFQRTLAFPFDFIKGNSTMFKNWFFFGFEVF